MAKLCSPSVATIFTNSAPLDLGRRELLGLSPSTVPTLWSQLTIHSVAIISE